MTMFDDIFDDIPLHHSLRIPPLIDPLPFLSAPLDRPSPLEPNARVNTHIENETAKLTGRRKALAEAKPLGDTESGDLRPLQESSRNDIRPIQKSPRKRQKLYDHEHIADFVQLPKPKATVKEDKPPPFQPVSILTELHEPPPSAALFPPISPGTTPYQQGWKIGAKTSKADVGEGKPDSVKKAANKQGKNDKSPPKRVSLRPQRMMWTEAEINQLVKGVAIYGMGKWKKILNHPEFTFQTGRTAVDLKDRFRTCFPQKDCVKHRTFANELMAQQPDDSSDCPPDQGLTEQSSRESGKPSAPLPLPFPGKRRKPRKPQVSRSPGPNRKRARRTPWSKEEDDAVREGYRQYGFQWTVIANDPSLGLTKRSGNQVRDRFRLKFAHLYGGGQGAKKKTAGGAALPGPLEGNPSAYSQFAEAKGSSKTMLIDDDDEEEEERVSIHESGSEGSSDEDDDHDHEPSSPKRSTGGVARAAAAAPFDITNILNDEEMSNRPSASFRYDGWGESESVTLPPLLLWEDMATRPMFELE